MACSSPKNIESDFLLTAYEQDREQRGLPIESPRETLVRADAVLASARRTKEDIADMLKLDGRPAQVKAAS